MKKIIGLFCLLTVLQVQVNAQSVDPESRNVGLTASFQSDQLDFLIPIWTSDQFVIAPNFGVVSAQDVGTDLTLGLVAKAYLSEVKEAVPYVAFRGGAIIGIPNNGDAITDIIAGTGFGGDYFFTPKFSVGIEIQGNLSVSDEGSFRFGNPGNVNFNTATALTASIYF